MSDEEWVRLQMKFHNGKLPDSNTSKIDKAIYDKIKKENNK